MPIRRAWAVQSARPSVLFIDYRGQHPTARRTKAFRLSPRRTFAWAIINRLPRE